MRISNRFRWLWLAAVVVAALFILAPLFVVLVGSLTREEYLTLPTTGLSLRWYAKLRQHPEFLDGFLKSVELGLLSSLLATILGTLGAIGLTRRELRRTTALSILLLSPLVVPSIITAMAILQFFSAIRITSARVTLLAAHTVITVPYVVRTVVASLSLLEENIEWAATNLGANPWRVIWHVVIPNIRAGVVAGAIFSFVVSFDTVTVSLFLSSPTYMPLPVQLYNFVEYAVDPVVAALSTLLVLFSAGGVYLTERVFGLREVLGANF